MSTVHLEFSQVTFSSIADKMQYSCKFSPVKSPAIVVWVRIRLTSSSFVFAFFFSSSEVCATRGSMVEGTPSCCEGREEGGGWEEDGRRGERREGRGGGGGRMEGGWKEGREEGREGRGKAKRRERRDEGE